MVDFGRLLNEKIADEIPGFWSAQVVRYTAASGLQLPYSKQELNKTLNWVVDNWRLELMNEDYNWIAKQKGPRGVSLELREQADRIWEGALYFIEQDFGYEEDTSHKTQDPAERLARALWEPFVRSKDEMFGDMENIQPGLRESEFTKSKTITKRFVYDIDKWIRLKLQAR